MAIMNQLGINSTTIYCFLIFIFTFFALKAIVFEPYFKAFEEREKRTTGGEENAKELLLKTQEIKATFEAEAKDLNAEVKSIFDEKRTLAIKEYTKIVTDARSQAEQYIEKTREHINSEVKKASEQLKVEVPGVALVITKKMLD